MLGVVWIARPEVRLGNFGALTPRAELLRTARFDSQIQIRQIQLIVGIMGLDDPSPAIPGLPFKIYDEAFAGLVVSRNLTFMKHSQLFLW